jgi:hypothetical protein
MPLIAVLGLIDILGVMAAIVFLVRRWQRRHPVELAAPAPAR